MCVLFNTNKKIIKLNTNFRLFLLPVLLCFFSAVSQDVTPSATEISLETTYIENSDRFVDPILNKDIPLKPEFEFNVASAFNMSEFSMEPSQITQKWTNTTPLRETHISNKNTDIIIINDSWIDPLSEFSIPETYIDSSNEILANEDLEEIAQEDDFDDFQAAPIESTSRSSKEISSGTTFDNATTINPILLNDNTVINQQYNDDISRLNRVKSLSSLVTDKDQNILKQTISNLSKETCEVKTIDDDEFTDFQSSIPDSHSNSNYISQLRPITHTNSVSDPNILNTNSTSHSVPKALPFEPLKPVPVYQKPCDSTPAQINWPDPGVTEHEIKKFEEIFSAPAKSIKEKFPIFEEKVLNTVTSVQKIDDSKQTWSDFTDNKNQAGNSRKIEGILPTPDISSIENTIKIKHNVPNMETFINNSSEEIWSEFVKHKTENSGKNSEKSKLTNYNIRSQKTEDDEWSDFVSAQKPSPVHKLSSRETERTSSPDLPLSVFNLSSIQPTKQPIPVITPQGLVQTKLSANVVNTSPKLQQKHAKQYFQPGLPMSMISPSIISNQYVTQAYKMNSTTSGQHSTSNQGKYKPSPKTNSLEKVFGTSPMPNFLVY